MNINNIIKSIMAEKNINQSRLANEAGFKNQSNISMLLKNNNMRVNNLFALINALECELVIRDKVTGVERVVEQNEKGD